ncbi:putative transposase-like protein [Klebsiella pneumoniae]|uniref:Putative transposase-like protein n=1 Tax=Klebsiella pneumoniae TaxID=573 RepID=A0A2X3E2K8_KLEPN|nr:putative transposase-like protein [Klebsiella pneumoniae]
MFYGRNWAGITLEKFICFLDRYIRWYNEKRIKLSGLAPIFPYTFYHLTHYWYAAADIPVANDIQRTMRMPFVIMFEGLRQGSLPLLTRRAST